MKNTKQILIAFILLFAILFSMMACTEKAEEPKASGPDQLSSENGSGSESGNGSDKSSESESDKKTQKPTEKIVYADQNYKLAQVTSKLKLIGRVQKLSNGLTCDFTASGIAFNAYIEGELSFTVDATLQSGKGDATYFTVFIDGERVDKRYEAKSGSNTIVIGDLGDMALHEVMIVKQNQSERSRCVLKNLKFYGALDSAAEEKELYIEILGDSITCGHGNLGGASGGGDRFEYEDGTQAYSFLTAQNLNADYNIVSQSGIGVYSGWTSYTMMDYYTKASWHRSQTARYDFSKARKPDVVIINLGTNDATFSSDKVGFKTNAKALINFIRQNYGSDVPIVWAYGMMGNALFDTHTSEALSELGGEEAGLYSIKLNKNGSGGQGHPVVSAHETAAKTLSDFILYTVLT